MKKGFTLLEIIVVLVIIGILATLGFGQYQRVIEKSRTAEAKGTLSSIRTMNTGVWEERGTYIVDNDILNVMNLPTTAATCNATYYFFYTTGGGATATATRCTAGGKEPQGPAAYSITVNVTGAMGGCAGWF